MANKWALAIPRLVSAPPGWRDLISSSDSSVLIQDKEPGSGSLVEVYRFIKELRNRHPDIAVRLFQISNVNTFDFRQMKVQEVHNK